MANSMYKKYKVEYTYTKRGDFQLYFMDNGEAIKIGISKIPEKRRRAIQGSSHLEVKILRTISVAYYRHLAENVEKKAHKFFRKHKIRGEWFSREIIDQIDNYAPTKTYLESKHDFSKSEAYRNKGKNESV
jgi:hypothetical protein